MTRSKSGSLTPPFSNPESAFRKFKRNGEETSPPISPTYSDVSESDKEEESEEEEDDIADINHMSLEEYATRTAETAKLGVVRLPIPNTTNFEPKGKFLHLPKDLPFNGNESDDAYQHVDDVLEIADYFKVLGVVEDAIMLRVFPITLKGNTKKWLKSQTAIEIVTWAKLKAKLLKQHNPPAPIAKLKAKILNFEQMESESLYETWTRYQEMLKG